MSRADLCGFATLQIWERVVTECALYGLYIGENLIGHKIICQTKKIK